MTAPSRILTARSYNRRRSRIHPAVDDDCELTMQSTKPTKMPIGLKPRTELFQSKTTLASENATLWPSLKECSSSSSDCEARPSIFRQRADFDESQHEDMLVLKRANPIYESDDEEADFLSSSLCSPTKKQRTCLDWDNRIPEDQSLGFSLHL